MKCWQGGNNLNILKMICTYVLLHFGQLYTNKAKSAKDYLIRFQQLVTIFLIYHFGRSHHELISFPSPEHFLIVSMSKIEWSKACDSTFLHVLYQYSDMQSTTSTDNECICSFTIFNFHCQISFQLTVQPVS